MLTWRKQRRDLTLIYIDSPSERRHARGRQERQRLFTSISYPAIIPLGQYFYVSKVWELFKLPPCCGTQQTLPDVGHSRHCLLCPTADIVFCGYRRQRMLCATEDDVCCVPKQTTPGVFQSRQCLLCPTADSVCCVRHQTTWEGLLLRAKSLTGSKTLCI